jgi:hypothetical protein
MPSRKTNRLPLFKSPISTRARNKHALVRTVNINKKYSIILFALFMTLAMDFAITLTMTVLMTGIDAGFPMRFAGGLLIGFIVGLPTSILVIPVVRKTVNKLTADH